MKIKTVAKEEKPLSRQRQWQAKMKAEGKCTRCGKKRSPKSVSQCIKCLKKARKRYQEAQAV